MDAKGAPSAAEVGCREPKARAALEAYWAAWRPSPDQRVWLEFQSRRFDTVISTLAPVGIRHGSKVLDVGAGSGGLSVALRARYGGDYHLVDFVEPPRAALDALRAQGVSSYRTCDLTARDPFVGIPPGYDVVLFVEVLEHLLVNPIPLLRSMGMMLRPGGHLVVTTPNQGRLGNRFKLLRGRAIREPDAFPSSDAPTYGHVQEYTPDELVRFVRVAGLTCEQLRVVQNLPSARPTRGQRTGARLLNGGLGRRSWLGDETVVLARRPTA